MTSAASFAQSNISNIENKPVAPAPEASGSGSGLPVNASTPAAPPQEVKPVFEKTRASEILNAVNTVVRDTGAGENTAAKGLRSALDVRLPLVLESCDLKIGHEILRIAYGVVTEAPDSSKVLRDLASDFARREMEDFKGVAPDCATALKGFGVAVTKVYLGDKWGGK
jgi:hypothetical protein